MSWCTRTGARARRSRHQPGVGQHVEEVAAARVEHVEPPVGRGLDHLRRASPGAPGTAKPHWRESSAADSASPAPRREGGGVAAHLGAALHPEWPRIGIRPAPGRPTLPRASARLTTARTFFEPNACWVRPMDQTRIARRRPRTWRRTRSMSARGRAGEPLELVEPQVVERRLELVEARVCSAMKRSSSAPVRDQRLQHAGDEGDVAAGVHRKNSSVILRPEHGALGAGRHPVALEARARGTG